MRPRDGKPAGERSEQRTGKEGAGAHDIGVLAVLSNCPQMHNPCNAYNPTPIRVIVHRSSV